VVKIFAFLLSLYSVSIYAAQEQIYVDFHFSVYRDAQGSEQAFEAFTKQADKNAFIGVSCSIQSPLPLIQVIVFETEILSESPRLVEVSLLIDNQKLDLPLNGILQVTDTADEFSNKIRFEIPAQRGSAFIELQDQYRNLLQKLKDGKALEVVVQHRTFNAKHFDFSLQGLKEGLKEREQLCF